jgi:hypothetical protein
VPAENGIRTREDDVGARKNYSFEKNQRAKAKAAKREAKRAQRDERKRQKAEPEEVEGEAPPPRDEVREDAATD